MSLTFGSLFAGVGGFDLGFEQAGFDCRFQVEWDQHCQQVLSYRWPDVPKWWDVSEVNGADLPPVDVITYGFPCQDLSVAGRRAGLDGGRSGLFFEAVRIVKEMREATDGRYPTWAVAENVAGLLNADGGHAMGRCLDELAEAGSLVIEWCLVDAQWFGVAQRRRRVFLASCFDPTVAGRCPDPLFPVGEGCGGDLTSVGSSGEQDAGSVEGGVGDGGGDGDQLDPVVFHPHRYDGFRVVGDVCNTVTAFWGTGGHNTSMVAQEVNVPTHDVVGTLASREFKGPSAESTRDGHLIPVAGVEETVGSNMPVKDVCPTLSDSDCRAPSTDAAHNGMLIPVSDLVPEVAATIDVSDATKWGSNQWVKQGKAIVEADLRVRRLTPLECERLMGWPEDHTLYRADGKKSSDSARYKMCGNGVVAPVARWVAKQLRRTLEVDGGTVES